MKYIGMFINLVGMGMIILGAAFTALSIEGFTIMLLASGICSPLGKLLSWPVVVAGASVSVAVVGMLLVALSNLVYEESTYWHGSYYDDSYDDYFDDHSSHKTTTTHKTTSTGYTVAQPPKPATTYAKVKVKPAVPAPTPKPAPVVKPTEPVKPPETTKLAEGDLVPMLDVDAEAPVPVVKDDKESAEPPVIGTMDEGPGSSGE